MNKIAKVSIVFVLLVAFSNSANAALFSWKLSNVPPTKLAFMNGSWNFTKIANKSAGNHPEQIADAVEEEQPEFEVVNTYLVRATAYSSTPDQTDDSPFITASGSRVGDGIIAANFLPFGTTVRIPDVYGNKVFVVEDRMNQRYWLNIDIWFPERESAKQFGVKRIKIEVVALAGKEI